MLRPPFHVQRKHAVVVHNTYWWCRCDSVWSKIQFKEGRQTDNCIESEHRSWETSVSVSEEREVVWRGYLFFIWRWKLRSGGESPHGITDWRCGSWGYCLSLLPLSPTPIHFPSPTFLIFTRELPLSPWERGGREGEDKKKMKGSSFSMPSSPASQSDSIHPTLLWSAQPCTASARLQNASGRAALGRSSGSSPACLSLRGKHRILSQPSSLTAFPSHSRVIKKSHLSSPIPFGVFFSSFHSSVRMSQRCECVGWHLYSARARLNYWDVEKWSYVGFVRLPLHGLAQALLCCHGSPWKTAFLLSYFS